MPDSGPNCAHIRVEYRTKQEPYDGPDLPGDDIHVGLRKGQMLTTGWWECASGCGQRFAVIPRPSPPPTAPRTTGEPDCCAHGRFAPPCGCFVRASQPSPAPTREAPEWKPMPYDWGEDAAAAPSRDAQLKEAAERVAKHAQHGQRCPRGGGLFSDCCTCGLDSFRAALHPNSTETNG